MLLILSDLQDLKEGNFAPFYSKKLEDYHKEEIKKDPNSFLEFFIEEAYDYFIEDYRKYDDNMDSFQSAFRSYCLHLIGAIDKSTISSKVAKEFLSNPSEISEATTKVQTIRFFADLPVIDEKINYSLAVRWLPEFIRDEQIQYLKESDLRDLNISWILYPPSFNFRSEYLLLRRALEVQLKTALEVHHLLNEFSSRFLSNENYKRALETALYKFFSSNLEEAKKLLMKENKHEISQILKQVAAKTLRIKKRKL